MKASLGRIIITLGVVAANGTDEQAAIITRVWSEKDTCEGPVCVNASVVPDCGEKLVPASSIMLFDTRAAAEAEQAKYNANPETRELYRKLGLSGPRVAFWPERV